MKLRLPSRETQTMKRRFFCFGSLAALLPLGMKKEPINADDEIQTIQHAFFESWHSVCDYRPTGTLMDMTRWYSRPVLATSDVGDPCNLEIARLVYFHNGRDDHYWIRCSNNFEMDSEVLRLSHITHWADFCHNIGRDKISVSYAKP